MVETLFALLNRLVEQELERNEILRDSGYADFAFSEKEAAHQGLEAFEKALLQKIQEQGLELGNSR